MSNDGPGSLGALYESNARRHVPQMPSVAGTSIGSAYDAWFEADQEAQWLRNLDESRSHASSDHTQVISRSDVDAYRERREAEKTWDTDADAALNVSSRSRREVGVSRETGGAPATQALPQTSPGEVGGNAADQAADTGGRGGILRSSAIMAAGTLVSRVLGLLRTSMTVAAIGLSTGVANTWDVANTLPNIIYLLLAGGVINAVLVPQITRALEHSDGGKAYTDRILTLTFMILAGVTVVFMAAAPLVYRLFDNNNMTDDKAHVALIFTLLCLPQIFFYGLYTILGQVLNARGRFGAFMWSPALANVVIIAGLAAYILMYPHGANTPGFSGMTTQMMIMLALPATLGIFAQAVVLIPLLKRAGYTYSPNFQFRGVGLRSASTMAGWAFAAVIVQQIGLVVTTQLLSSQPDGQPNKAAQSNAFLLFSLPHSLITLSLVTALFTRMSVAAGRGETQKVKDDMTTGIRLSGIASVMLTFGCFVLVFPLVGLWVGPVESSLWAIGSIAITMMIGLVPFSLCLIIQRVFYAYGDAKTPFWMQILCTGTAIGLTLPWFNWHNLTEEIFGRALTDWTGLQGAHFFGQPGVHWVGVGVGLAQTLSNVVQASVGFVLLKRKIGHVPMSETVRTYVRLAIASLLATAFGFLVQLPLHDALPVSRFGSFLEIAVVGSIFLAVYLLVANRLRVEEINSLTGPVARRLKRS